MQRSVRDSRGERDGRVDRQEGRRQRDARGKNIHAREGDAEFSFSRQYN